MTLSMMDCIMISSSVSSSSCFGCVGATGTSLPVSIQPRTVMCSAGNEWKISSSPLVAAIACAFLMHSLLCSSWPRASWCNPRKYQLLSLYPMGSRTRVAVAVAVVVSVVGAAPANWRSLARVSISVVRFSSTDAVNNSRVNCTTFRNSFGRSLSLSLLSDTRSLSTDSVTLCPVFCLSFNFNRHASIQIRSSLPRSPNRSS
mmetsp:Transcript_17923/g.18133  ORF Transcript_17923/g.18133 Transcript_17923/m.18133 type:complete len:202 (-) Transcript_17923:145-750(-)